MRLLLLSVFGFLAESKITGKARKEKLEEITNGGSKMAEISATQFKDLISDALESKTDYSIAVHYTALPERFGCKICEQFMKETGYVAKAKAQDEKKVYFLSVDFGGLQMQKAFQTFGIQNVPALVIVDGKGGMPKESFKLLTNQIRKERDFASQVVDFVTLKIPEAKFGKIVKPIDFTPLLITAFFAVSIFGALYALRNVIFNRFAVAALVIAFCMITTSGFTFCQIRGAPAKGRDGSLFAQGGRMMYVSEAYIKMMAEAGVAAGLVVMNGKGPLRNTVGLALAFVSYVVLLAAFQVKTPHYPYGIVDLF